MNRAPKVALFEGRNEIADGYDCVHVFEVTRGGPRYTATAVALAPSRAGGQSSFEGTYEECCAFVAGWLAGLNSAH